VGEVFKNIIEENCAWPFGCRTLHALREGCGFRL